MRKISTILLLGALLVIISTPIRAEEKVYTENTAFWKSTLPDSCVDTLTLSSFPKTLSANDTIWIYANNGYIPPNTKYLSIELYGTDLYNKLEYVDQTAKGYYYDGTWKTVAGAYKGKYQLPNGVGFSFVLDPQPACEKIKIKAITAATIQSGKAKAICNVPSITNYGLIVLLALLLLSGVIVIRQRRRAAVRA